MNTNLNIIKDIEAECNELLSTPSALSKYDYLRITDKSKVSDPIPVVKIAGETISTRGNITVGSGESKGGKSALFSIIIAGAASATGEIDGLEGLEVTPNVERKAVIHFDTEQAKHKHKRNLLSIQKRAGLTELPDFLLSYNIRQLEINSYKETAQEICEGANEKFNGIHSIFIDGGADFVHDVNDPIESNAIVKFFEELAIQFDCPVFIIIHTNPGSNKERGHLGSQLQRKAESVINIKSEGDISFIEPKFLREAGKGNIPHLQFTYDREKGYHVSAGVKKPDEAQKQEQRKAFLISLANKVFGGQKSFKYGEAIKVMKEESGKSEAPVKGFIRDMKELGLIEKGSDEYYRLV